MFGADALFNVGDVVHRRASPSDGGSGTGARWLTCVREPIDLVAAAAKRPLCFWLVFWQRCRAHVLLIYPGVFERRSVRPFAHRRRRKRGCAWFARRLAIKLRCARSIAKIAVFDTPAPDMLWVSNHIQRWFWRPIVPNARFDFDKNSNEAVRGDRARFCRTARASPPVATYAAGWR